MQRYLVNSTSIRSVGWENNVMELQFWDGAIYQYLNVSQDEYLRFLNSPSLGRALVIIEKFHPYIRVC